jgi:hypothetical protein
MIVYVKEKLLYKKKNNKSCGTVKTIDNEISFSQPKAH